MRPFLTAEWRHLVMLNHEIDPAILEPLVPPGTHLDTWHGRTFISLVAFLFQGAKLHCLSIPFHRNFEEVNLRFYVIRPHAACDRRGVVFIREIVPRRLVVAVARGLYNENFSYMPMTHRTTHDPLTIEYAWRTGAKWSRLRASSTGDARRPIPGSHEEFIAEHYFAYTRHPAGGATEHHVEHAPWTIRPLDHVTLVADLESLYGKCFAAALSTTPTSAFLADGSPVNVRKGTRIC